MNSRFAVAVLAVCLAVNALAAAATLKGTVKNGSTATAAVHDDVVLISLADGMKEIARTRTDARGAFSFTVADLRGSHLVRVLHQGVTYHKMVSLGVTLVDVQVYDVANKLDAVAPIAEVQRFQADGDTLQVIEQIAVRNASNPPRTLMNERSVEVQLPPGAQVESGMVQSAGSQPLTRMPVADNQGRHYFSFPLRPGDTRFQVVYRLPYTGTAVIDPRILYPLERFVVVVPKSMKFEAQTAGRFQAAPSKTDDNVQVAAAAKPGDPLAFRVSGAGALAELVRQQQQVESAQTARPGGGLGAPIAMPDPLHNYRWVILAGLSTLLLAGAVRVTRKPAAARSSYRSRPLPKSSARQRWTRTAQRGLSVKRCG